MKGECDFDDIDEQEADFQEFDETAGLSNMQESISRHPKKSSDLFNKPNKCRLGPGFVVAKGPGNKFSFSTSNFSTKDFPGTFIEPAEHHKISRSIFMQHPPHQLLA